MINQNGVKAYSQKNISLNDVDEAISGLKGALYIGRIQVPRVPHPASIRLVWENDVDVPLNRAITNLTEILLPDEMSDSLAGIKHLIVVPTQMLGAVPYGVLKPFEDDMYLVDKMSVSVAPSLFDLWAEASPWNNDLAFSSALIVGNPTLPYSDEWTVPALPGAETEAYEVAELLDEVPLVGELATKDAIVERAPESTFLYFATHGISSYYDPLEGGLLMFSATTLEQGWWTAREIQNANLNAEIAVLSACQTGLGRSHDAGTIGISRAFQIAGVPRVVMSLWNVDDESTNLLMQSFVRNLENEMPAEALRQAMLETREIYPSPLDWASFTLFGTPR
ncbi:CHAT domain-containing protein [Romeria aff. gracilis LEGE 07310]|uniref:CHAT domain-containing protein n=1 Tax=Vasconcelosia minhoensis LEGE 07310 TaxID=915328 RepID=A0A8J7ASG2_9CYAN|nr:CHAT domain-containing protein [Romeria gracilis]MBE9079876.1 CHAT domain-containing protein [Romeria aff. gracilis LEGE 07310]